MGGNYPETPSRLKTTINKRKLWRKNFIKQLCAEFPKLKTTTKKGIMEEEEVCYTVGVPNFLNSIDGRNLPNSLFAEFLELA